MPDLLLGGKRRPKFVSIRGLDDEQAQLGSDIVLMPLNEAAGRALEAMMKATRGRP